MAKAGKALVTGGAGFIGSNLVDRLLRDGNEVRVLDNFATGRRENLAHVANDVELVEGDVQSYERAHTAVQGCELVFHLAALPSVPRSIQDPLTSTASNVTGTLNVLLAARDAGVRRVVYASSSSAYGPQKEFPQREEAAARPISPYGVSKLAAEGYCRAFTNVYGLETVAVRYFNVFGPRQDPLSQYAAVIPRFITKAAAGERPTIFGDGEQSRDFTYIDNTVDGTVLAGSAEGAAGETFNVACGEAISLNELWRHVAEIVGTDVEPVYADAQPGDLRRSMADISRAREVLGYEPSVDVRAGLEKTFVYLTGGAQPASRKHPGIDGTRGKLAQ
jgi:UDP-N-acetylglucosamine/UDP-N-acetyl-alpha-D-glucosaminouronate 4-epimerase